VISSSPRSRRRVAGATLPDRDHGDRQRDDRVEPPDARRGVRHQPGENPYGQPGAEEVLLPLALRRRRPETIAEPLLGESEPRADEQCPCREHDANHTRLGMVLDDQRPEGLDGDVRREQEEADPDELLCAPFCVVGERPLTP
jgi:hypothetical protein